VAERERIHPYLQRLYGYVFSLARDHHQEEDLVQECASRALKARRPPADEPAYRAWLFRILGNLFLDQVRREKSALAGAAVEKFAPETEY
jgi:RNA polymerase sigma-70 factor (ECF subfamily)